MKIEVFDEIEYRLETHPKIYIVNRNPEFLHTYLFPLGFSYEVLPGSSRFLGV